MPNLAMLAPNGPDPLDPLVTGRDMLHVFQEALRQGGHAEGSAPAHIADIEVRDFQHGTQTMRGLSSKVGIPRGELLLVVPKPMRSVPKDTFHARFGKPQEPEPVHVGLWLAEKRAELASKKAAGVVEDQADSRTGRLPRSHTEPRSVKPLSPEDQYWDTYVRSIPTIEALKAQGIPLLQPEGDLEKLLHLPHVSVIPKFVKATKEELSQYLWQYNRERGDRPPLSWTDALWGRAVVDSRGFSCKGASLVPVADLLNSSSRGDSNANVMGHCDEDFLDLISFVAQSDIKPGEELTVAYASEDPASTPSGLGPWLVKKYGIATGADAEPWNAAQCRSFKQADWSKSESSLLRTIDELARRNCSVPVTKESEAAMRNYRRNYSKAIVTRREKLFGIEGHDINKGDVYTQMVFPLPVLLGFPRSLHQSAVGKWSQQGMREFL